MSRSPVLQWCESEKAAILKTYGRTCETVLQDIENIKMWMAKQPHLPEIPADKVIEGFLILNKFRIEKTKKKLDMYYSIRSMIPEFYDIDPNGPAMHTVMDAMCFIPMPKLTKELERIIVIKLKDPDIDFDPFTYVSYTLSIVEIRLREGNCLEEVHIWDLAGLKFNHIAKFTPQIIRKGHFIIENVFSTKVKGIHLLNATSFLDSTITFVKSLLSDKLSQRIHLHKDLESLHKVVQKNVLPLEYGGDEKSIKEMSNDWKKMFLEYNDVLQHLRRLKVDENKRQGDRLDNDFSELQGNFRQLVID